MFVHNIGEWGGGGMDKITWSPLRVIMSFFSQKYALTTDVCKLLEKVIPSQTVLISSFSLVMSSHKYDWVIELNIY